MPITSALYRVLFEDVPVNESVKSLWVEMNKCIITLLEGIFKNSS